MRARFRAHVAIAKSDIVVAPETKLTKAMCVKFLAPLFFGVRAVVQDFPIKCQAC